MSPIHIHLGLQMYDNGKWISIPKDHSVIWCGATAEEVTNGKIKAGIHFYRIDRIEYQVGIK
jgi:isopenicillin N synthase-like dioxygenase